MQPAIHISLNVKDLDRSIEFYQKLFGPPAKLKPGYAKFVGVRPDLHLALQAHPGVGTNGALSHLGIRVADSAEVVKRRAVLADAGLMPADEMNVNCCYARQDKFWVHDPDGNSWEIYTVLEDTDELHEMPAGATAAESPCCVPTASPVAINTEEKQSGCCS